MNILKKVLLANEAKRIETLGGPGSGGARDGAGRPPGSGKGSNTGPGAEFDNVKVKGGKLEVSRGTVRNSQDENVNGVRYKLTVQPRDKHLAKETKVFRVHQEGDTHVVSDSDNTLWNEHASAADALSSVKDHMNDFVKSVKGSSARVGGY